MAQAVRQSTHHLREQQYDTVAQFVERAADQIERFSNHLRERDLNDLVSEAQRFARQQPAVFIGSSFAAGHARGAVHQGVAPARSFDDRGYSGYGVDRRRPATPASYAAREHAGRPRCYGGGTAFGGRSSFDRDTSFGTRSDRPGDVDGPGRPVMEPRKDDKSLGELFSELSRDTADARSQGGAARTHGDDGPRDQASGGTSSTSPSAGSSPTRACSRWSPPWSSCSRRWASPGGPRLSSSASSSRWPGYLFVQRGISGLQRDSLTPTETIETLKENAAWAKGQRT